MDSGLVYILNDELRRSKISAIGMDLDGTLTDLQKPEIQNLIGSKTLEALPDDLKRALGRTDYEKLEKKAKVSVGWYLDLETGYLLQPNPQGRVIKGRRGAEELSDKVISEEYGTKIELPFSLEMDKQKPRFLPICDGFDYVEGVITAALAAIPGLPRRRTLREIAAAVRKAHGYAQEGFKKEILRNPERYGIKPNPDLINFLDELKARRYKVFLLTASKRQYASELLNLLGLRGKGYFNAILTGMTKPACFIDGTESNLRLVRALRKMRVPRNQVIYIGDHLIKDVISARQAGFRTCLRTLRTYINTVSYKLTKYVGINFKKEGTLRIGSGQPSEKQLTELGNYFYLVHQYAHLMTPKLSYLRPVLLY